MNGGGFERNVEELRSNVSSGTVKLVTDVACSGEDSPLHHIIHGVDYSLRFLTSRRKKKRKKSSTTEMLGLVVLNVSSSKISKLYLVKNAAKISDTATNIYLSNKGSHIYE